jgi:uncharacterized phage protein (TIGR02220 family)
MELIFFIKDLRKKGAMYYNTWMPLLMQFDLKDSQRIELNATIGIPRTTYHRIINYGVENFPKYIKDFEIVKERSALKINIINNNNLEVPKEIKKEVVKVVKKEVSKVDLSIYIEIIDYLNNCTGQAYKPTSKTNQKYINERLKEGHSVDDFKKVIETKATKWLNTQYQDYLRPQTLFGSKFEAYLNESVILEKTKQEKAYDTVNQATELGWNN